MKDFQFHRPTTIKDAIALVREIIAQPGGPTTPEVWMLGSSDYGPQVAAYFGLPFCFAHFITDGRGVEQAMELYRQTYRPSARHAEPYAALCVWAMVADTEAEAARLFSSREMWRLGRDRGVYTELPSPDEAAVTGSGFGAQHDDLPVR